MAKILILIALCVLPALVSAIRPARNPFLVTGKVYCDTCRAGFETSASTYIHGAVVRVECKDLKSMDLVYSKEATTDSTGAYKLLVDEEHEDQVCDCLLVSSPHMGCSKISPGREKARVILTRNNGIASDNRYANNMGFETEYPASGCTQVLQQYQEIEE